MIFYWNKQQENKMKWNTYLEAYKPRNSDKVKSKEEVFKNASIFFQGITLVVVAFEDNFFPSPKISQHKKWAREKYAFSDKLTDISEEEIYINKELFQKHFKFQRYSLMLRGLYSINDKEKNNELVNMIKSELSDLKGEIEKMSKDEKIIEQPDGVVDITEEILDFNNQNQKGPVLKILSTDQILSRLPSTLTQLKAGNNSEKLKNKIRQLLYLLYRSKMLTKIIYNNLINTI